MEVYGNDVLGDIVLLDGEPVVVHPLDAARKVARDITDDMLRAQIEQMADDLSECKRLTESLCTENE